MNIVVGVGVLELLELLEVDGGVGAGGSAGGVGAAGIAALVVDAGRIGSAAFAIGVVAGVTPGSVCTW